MLTLRYRNGPALLRASALHEPPDGSPKQMPDPPEASGGRKPPPLSSRATNAGLAPLEPPSRSLELWCTKPTIMQVLMQAIHFRNTSIGARGSCAFTRHPTQLAEHPLQTLKLSLGYKMNTLTDSNDTYSGYLASLPSQSKIRLSIIQ